MDSILASAFVKDANYSSGFSFLTDFNNDFYNFTSLVSLKGIELLPYTIHSMQTLYQFQK